MHHKLTGFTLAQYALCLIVGSQILLANVSVFAEDKKENQSNANTEKYHLHYQFKPGEFVHYQVSDASSYTTQKGIIKETAKNHSIAWRQYRVVSVDPAGEAVLELMIERVRLQAQFDSSPPVVFDSADPELQPDRFKYILSTVGKPMSRIRVSKRGELLNIQNLFGKQPETVDPTLNFLVVFPEKPIAIDETWNQILEVEVSVTKLLKEKVKLLRKYTLKSVKDGKAEISLSTALITTIRDPAIKVRLIQQSPSGTILFDINRHLLLSRELATEGQVIGPFGAETLVKAVSKRSEKMLPSSTAKLDKEAAPATR